MSHGHSHGDQECTGHHEDEGSSNGVRGTHNMQQMMQLARQLNIGNETESKEHQFWNTQPVPKIDESVDGSVNEAIEPNLPIDKVRQEAYSLDAAFEWSNVDLGDDAQLKELYTLLTENYVEDDDRMFRFDYSPEFLRWALQVPGWKPQWHCGVRVAKSKRLVAFIAAIPQKINVFDKTVEMVEINFLCVHQKMRSRKVAPVLIREITRRVNQQGIFQAVYTAGIVIPRPVSICRYWHRSLNPKKLIDVKFSHLGAKMTLARTIKLFKLPQDVASRGLRPFEKKDAKCVHALLSAEFKNYDLTPAFSVDEVEYIFLPRENVVYAYVVETEGKITDFISFYSLPSSVMQHPTHKTIHAAYSFYNVATAVPYKQLMNDALILAYRAGFDVFNALDLMRNSEVLEDLKFGIGDGNLQYYLYNWKCSTMTPKKIGLVLQ